MSLWTRPSLVKAGPHAAAYNGLYGRMVRKAAPNTYFVSPTGVDTNSGRTELSPRLTLASALSLCKPGDRVFLRGGTYSISTGMIPTTGGGAAGAPVVVMNYPGEVPIWDATAMAVGLNDDYTNGFVLDHRLSYIWYMGIEVTMGRMGGIYVQTGQNPVGTKFFGMNVHHNGRGSSFEGQGINFENGTDIEVGWCDSHHNANEVGGSAWQSGDGFAWDVGRVTGPLWVHDNRSHDNSDDGFDFYNTAVNTPGKQGYLIENNWAFFNGYRLDRSTTGGDGNGFKMGGGDPTDTRTSGGHTIRRNVAWKNRTHGFSSNDGEIPSTFESNTGWENGTDDFSCFSALASVANVFRNNISVTGNVANVGMSDSPTETTNSWNVVATETDADFASTSATIAEGVRSPYTKDLPRSNFLRLATGSDLIGTATESGYGTNPGAFPVPV